MRVVFWNIARAHTFYNRQVVSAVVISQTKYTYLVEFTDWYITPSRSTQFLHRKRVAKWRCHVLG